VFALKKWQNWRAPPSQSGARAFDSGINSEVNQASIKYFNRVVTSPSGHVDFRQVQVELHFIASQT
jgi:hypothetical protein